MQKRRIVSVALSLAVAFGLLISPNAEAKKAPKLAKTAKVTVGKAKTLTVKNVTKKAKITWKSSKTKIVKVKKTSYKAAKLTAKKAGKAVVSAKVKVGSKKYTLKCNVTVKAKKNASSKASTTKQTATDTPKATATPAPTAEPTPTPVPTKPPYDYGSIRYTYQDVFSHIGTCANVGMQMADEEIVKHLKYEYNSVTLENEMKPDAILGSKATSITVDEAKALGYIIPDGYKDATVPKLNFDTVDKALQWLNDNNMQMRAHTLVWHSQTPSWFFSKDFAGNDVVDTETMDGRLEFYVRTMFKHVMDKEKEICGQPGKLVYAWDVTNEYLHRSEGKLSWVGVYGDTQQKYKDELEKNGNRVFGCTYVKKAFEFAYDMLKQYNATDNVTLFYNDYDTYFEVEDVLALVNYINDGEPSKICGGIGMQSHLDIDRPLISEFKTALDAFLNTGLEVQMTELDITINWDHLKTYDYKKEKQTDADQAAFTKEFMEMVVKTQRDRDKKISPKGITGLTIWGLYDEMSWRGKSTPLFFKMKDNVFTPKESLDALLAAKSLWK